MNKFFLLALTTIVAFSACSDSDDTPIQTDPANTNKYITGKDLTVEYKLNRRSSKFNKENYFALGYGYDITQKYAHPDGIREKVIDSDKVSKDPELQHLIITSGTSYFGSKNYASGTIDNTKKELLENIKIDQEYKNAFKEIFNIFNVDSTFHNVNYYYNIESYNAENYSSTLVLNPADNVFNDLVLNDLSDTFLQDIKSLSSESIILKYGTHVMLNIVFGWRKDYYYRSTSNQNLLGRQLGSMEKVLGSSLGLGIFSSNKENVKGEKENLYVEYVDGSCSKNIINAWMFDVTNYSGNIIYDNNINETFNPENLVLIDWGSNEKPLIPIYEFVSDTVKKEAIKKAFDNYLNK